MKNNKIKDLEIEKDLLHAKYNVARRLNNTIAILASIGNTEGMTIQEIKKSKRLKYIDKLWAKVNKFFSKK